MLKALGPQNPAFKMFNQDLSNARALDCPAYNMPKTAKEMEKEK